MAGWTPAARDQLERELTQLRDQRTDLAPAAVDDPGAGDLADRAEVLQRDDELSLLDRRIDEIRALLERGPQVAEPGGEQPEGMPDGTRVTVRHADDTVENLLVVAAVEEVPERDRPGTVTVASPLGQALAGHATGDTVSYDTPDGVTRVHLLGVQPPDGPTGPA